MTFNAPSFFVGIGTVLGLLVVGFGSGALMSSVFLDKGAREPNRIERRAADVVKPPVIEATPVPAVSVPAPQPAPPAPLVAEPAPAPLPAPSPAPQIQQATTQGEPQPKPQVRRVIIPPEPQPQPQQHNSPPATLPRPAPQIQQATTISQPEPPPGAAPPPAVRRVPLGAEQPVALTNPAQERTDTPREARKKAREAKREKKKLERQLAEQRRQQRFKQAEELQAARRPRQVEVDDDDDDREERPSFFRRERGGPFGRSFFRQYGDDQ